MMQNSGYTILTEMLAPALFLAATGSLLISANNRLARVVDRLRLLFVHREEAQESEHAFYDMQIGRHRGRSVLLLRACQLLYGAMSAFVGTSLTVALDASLPYRLEGLPTILAIAGVLMLLLASLCLGLEVSRAVRSLGEELEFAKSRQRYRG